MPQARRERYIQELGLPEYDAMVLTLTREMSDFFDATLEVGADAKQASNWLMGDVSHILTANKNVVRDEARHRIIFFGMIQLIADGTISSKIAKKVFKELIEHGGDAKKSSKKKDWFSYLTQRQLLPIITEILDNNAQSIEDFKNGKDRAVGFLVGQAMKQTKGKANPVSSIN